MNVRKSNFQFWGQKKEAVCDVNTSDVHDEDDDFYWSDSDFSDDETNENGNVQNDSNPDNSLYNDISENTYQDVGSTTEDFYENFTSEAGKGNEMLTPPPTLPPRKADQPKPPARRKKEKKPPLPEKIHLDPEDNQFYEEMNTMTLDSLSSAPPTKINVLPPSSRCPKNKSIREDEGDRKSSLPSTLPPRKMPAIPSMTASDPTRPQKKTMSHTSLLNRPRIDTPKEKEDPLNSFRWYHGDSERMVVEKKLLHHKMDGMFAVRNSKTKGPSYPHAVTLYQNGKTFNFPIRIRDSDKRFALGSEKKNEPSFESLNSLVEYFKTNKIKLMNNQSAILNIPLDRFS